LEPSIAPAVFLGKNYKPGLPEGNPHWGGKMKASSKGAVLASAVAALFIANAAFAEEKAPVKSNGGAQAKVKCVGGNDCKGKGSCQGATHDCAGKNDCKGKGYVETSTAKECADKGGHVDSSM
jgi:hypothetical protein